MPSHPGAVPRLDRQFLASMLDRLVISQWNASDILGEMAALNAVLASLQVDIACIQETIHLPKDTTPEIPQYRAVCPIQGRQVVEDSSFTYVPHWHSLLSTQLLGCPTCWSGITRTTKSPG